MRESLPTVAAAAAVAAYRFLDHVLKYIYPYTKQIADANNNFHVQPVVEGVKTNTNNPGQT